MKRTEHALLLPYTFDPTHSGANYSFDGEHWINAGEFAEVITKDVLGYEPRKEPNTRYDVSSDIEPIRTSVKSSRFTLVNMRLGDTFEESVDHYFKTTHSTQWIYTVVTDDTVLLYWMNATEFRDFLYTFCYLNERQVVRCRATSGKMLRWLEGRARD